jgi:uncharacterized membrane protein HdeD (DUF308 family)
MTGGAFLAASALQPFAYRGDRMWQEGYADDYWWVYAATGILAIILGLIALFWPHITVGLFLFFFGIFAILYGVLALVDMFRRIGARHTWWPQLLVGVISIGAGLYALGQPYNAATILAYVIAFWAIFVGLFEIFASIAAGQWLLLVVGLLTTAFGFIILANPRSGFLALIMVLGIFYIVHGIVLLVQSFSMPGQTTGTV